MAPKKSAQDKLYAYYLDDAVDNARWFSMFFRDEFRDEPEFSEKRLIENFHKHVASLGSPYADRAEAAEVVLDAYAVAIENYSWQQWLSEKSSELGKMGLRAEALLLISAIESGDPQKWYAEKSEMWDDPKYSRVYAIPRAKGLLGGQLILEAEARPSGYLLSDVEMR